MTEWNPSGKYCIKRDNWSISKAFVDGSAIYTLFDEAGTRYGYFESADDAKQYALAMELAETP